jgi:phosphoserine phosphatase
MTTDEFETIVRDWITTAKHPVTKRLYSEMVYQPMLEVLAYLRANGFKTFIVSGGGISVVLLAFTIADSWEGGLQFQGRTFRQMLTR